MNNLPLRPQWQPFRRKGTDLEQHQTSENDVEESFSEKFKPFCNAVLFGNRTKRTVRILIGMLPLYLMFILLPDEPKTAFIPFAMVLQYIALAYGTPRSFGMAWWYELGNFLGVLIGCFFTSLVLTLCIGANIYVAYLGILLCICIAEPLFTTSNIPGMLGLLPWIVMDSTLITNLTDILQVDTVSYVTDLWTGSIEVSLFKNDMVSVSMCLGFGLIAFILPPVTLEFVRMYQNTSAALLNLSKEFGILTTAFRAPETNDGVDEVEQSADPQQMSSGRQEAKNSAGILVQEKDAKSQGLNETSIDSKVAAYCRSDAVATAATASSLLSPTAIVLDDATFQSAQSLHYERVIADLKNSVFAFETTRAKVRKIGQTVDAAKSEFPLHTPFPLPKLPFSGFAHTCDPVLWKSFLLTVSRLNRDGLAFAEYNSAVLSGIDLNQELLNLMADVLAYDASILRVMSSGTNILTDRHLSEVREESEALDTELQLEQQKQANAVKAVKLVLLARHKAAFFRRTALFSNPKSATGFRLALKNRLDSTCRPALSASLDSEAMQKHEVLDVLLRHFYESSTVAFLAMMGGTRLNAEKGSLTSMYRQIVDKTLNRTWREEMFTWADPILRTPWQVAVEYRNWLQMMYSGLSQPSLQLVWKSFCSYWDSNRGRRFLRTFIGLGLIYSPSVFSQGYRTLWDVGSSGSFGGWQIHAFISSSQPSAESTVKKVFWRLIGNALGGLVSFLVLVIWSNDVYLMGYLVLVTIFTTWFLNGSEDQHFGFSIQFGYAFNSFGVVQHLVISHVNTFASIRDLAIFVATRVLSQIVGTLWALVIGLTILPNFAYDRATDISFTNLNRLFDQVANKAFDLYLGFADKPVDLREAHDDCEKTVQTLLSNFQLARRTIEGAEKYGILKFLGTWFYDGGQAETILKWSATVMTSIEGIYHMALRNYSPTMGEFRCETCIYAANSELMLPKSDKQRQAAANLMQATKARLEAAIQILRYYSEAKNSKELRGWKARWHKMRHGGQLPNDTLGNDDELLILKTALTTRIYEFWIAFLEFEQSCTPLFEQDDFDSWYPDLYRFDAFLGFLTRLEDLMVGAPM